MSQQLIESARDTVTLTEDTIMRLNGQMQRLRADIDKTTDNDRRKRLEVMLKEMEAISKRAQEQRSRALRDLERYGAQR